MFEAILQSMNESAPPQPMPFAAGPQIPATQSAATPLGGIIAVLQNKTDVAAPASMPNANPDRRFGPLIVPADTLVQDTAADAASQPQQAAQTPIAFPFRPTSASSARMAAADQMKDAATDADPAPSQAAVPLDPAPIQVAAPTQDTEQAIPQQNTEQAAAAVPPPPRPAKTAQQNEQHSAEPAAPPVQPDEELPAAPQPVTSKVTQQNPQAADVPAPQPSKSNVAQQDQTGIAVPVSPAEAAAKGKTSQQDLPKVATDAAPQPVTSKVTQQNPQAADVPAPQPSKSKVAQQDQTGIAVPKSPAEAAAKPTKGKSSQQDRQKVAADAAPQPAPQPEPVAQLNTQPIPTVVPQQPDVQQTPIAQPTVMAAAEDQVNDEPAVQPVAANTAKSKLPSAGQHAAATPHSTMPPSPVPQSPLPEPQATPVGAADADAPPLSDANADAADTPQQQPQVASANPAPPVFVAPMAAPAQATPVAKPVTEAISSVTTEAPKNAHPAADAGTADQNTPAAPFKAHLQGAPHAAAPKPDVSAAPANGQAAPPVADASNNNSAIQNAAAGANTAAAQNTGAPQADNPVPAQPHQPPTPPVAQVNPALQQAAPSGLRKLATGLQLSAQEQETTSTLDKIGVSIVTRATEGLRHFDIRLDPPELGRVDVRLSVDDSGKAHASLIVDKPQTLEMLQRDSSSLNRALTDAGLDLSNNGLNFSLRDPNRQNDGGVDQGRGRALSAKAVVQTDATPIHSSLGSYAPNSVRLDIRV